MIVYAGKETNARPGDLLGTRIVLQLLQHIAEPRFYTVTFDNFFTSRELLLTLKEKNFAALGTVRYNRLDRAPLPLPAAVKKTERGAYTFCTDGKIVAVVWNDNRPVYAASNHKQVTPTVNKRRFSQAEKKYIQVECPAIIDSYNQTMGGVDIFDRYLSDYRPTIRGKKWYFPFFTNALNVCSTASWKLHREIGGLTTHLQFLRYIVRTLLKQDDPMRSSSAPRSVLADVRYDGVNHSLDKNAKEGRCKLCSKNTFFRCSKCNQRLHQKCFFAYHSKP